MTGPVARTVDGDVPLSDLGRVDYHEHLLMRSPLLRGDELDDVSRSSEETAELHAAGIETLCELTPIGTGRDPRGVREIARRSGMQIVLATGVHREAHYPPEHWTHRVDETLLADLFTRDILEGCDAADYGGPLPDPTSIRAGVIKIGAGYWSVSAFERKVFAAAGAAHRRTGAPIVAHLELGTAAFEVLDLLAAAGVAAEHIALAHCDRNPDPGLHAELINAGAFLGYDGIARAKYWPDDVILGCLEETLERAVAPRILLGGDVARRSSFTSYGGLPGMAYLPQRFIPRAGKRLGADTVHQILVDNPAQFLALDPRL